MKLITNLTKNNHKKALIEIIESSTKIIICSGGVKNDGLQIILPSFEKAIRNNNATVTIFSNEENTDSKAIDNLKKLDGIEHFMARRNHRYLHSKIFHFEHNNSFTSIIGSANLTKGGLISNDELSIKFSGIIGTTEHNEILNYLERLNLNLRKLVKN